MDTTGFTKEVRSLSVDLIDANPDNPRGLVDEDASFERLVSSINEVGILVPVVVRQATRGRFVLVDGERRFKAAKRLRIPKIPAHILSGDADMGSLRKFMFHLHMTREQWEPLAQCKSLAEMYPAIGTGIALSKKQEWAKKIAQETWMNARTAKDRVHVLAWPGSLKKKIYAYDTDSPDRDIYSYVLAIEASIIEPSAKCYHDFYEYGKHEDKVANSVRTSLFEKTVSGMEVGVVTSRDQIRSVEPLFQATLNEVQFKLAVKIFTDLVDKPKYSYDDAFAQIETQLPELLAERPPKPQRLIGSIRSLTETLKLYKPEFVDGVRPENLKKKLKIEMASALTNLSHAAKTLKDGIS